MGETLEKKVYLYNVDRKGSFSLSSYKQSCIFLLTSKLFQQGLEFEVLHFNPFFSPDQA